MHPKGPSERVRIGFGVTAVGSIFDREKYGSRALEQLTTISMARKVISKTAIVQFGNVNILKQITNADTSFGSDSPGMRNETLNL